MSFCSTWVGCLPFRNHSSHGRSDANRVKRASIPSLKRLKSAHLIYKIQELNLKITSSALLCSCEDINEPTSSQLLANCVVTIYLGEDIRFEPNTQCYFILMSIPVCIKVALICCKVIAYVKFLTKNVLDFVFLTIRP